MLSTFFSLSRGDQFRLLPTTFNNFGVEEFFIMVVKVNDMTVYIEDAFLENFLLDGILLYLALRLAKAKISLFRLGLSSLLGALAAVFFPLLPVRGALLLLIKVLLGLLLVLLSVKERLFRVYAVALSAFFGGTFLLGGLILSVCSVFFTNRVGEGYILQSVPIGLVLSLGFLLALCGLWGSKRMYRYIRRRQNLAPCKLVAGKRELSLRGYIDSGNNLLFRGAPVCVVPPLVALKLFHGSPPAGRMTVHTVSGERETPVFTLDKLVVCGAEREHVFVAVGEIPSKEHSLILHTALVEDVHENSRLLKGMLKKVRSK